MRNSRFTRLTLALLAAFGAAICARAGDEVAPDPENKRVSDVLPEKKVDLTGLDVTKPQEDPKVKQQRDEQETGETPAEEVRYQAMAIAPEGARAVAEFPDVGRMLRSADKSPLGRLMSEEMLGRVWRRQVLGALREVPASRKGLPGGDGLLNILDKLVGILGGEVVVAVYPPAEEGKPPRLLILGDTTEDGQDSFRDALTEMREWAGFGEEASTRPVTHEPFSYDKIIFQKSTAVSYGFVGNQLVIATGDGLYDKVLAAAISKGDHSLLRDTDWVETRRNLGDNADIYFRVDAGFLADTMIRPDMKEEDRKAVRASFRGVRFFAAALGFSTGMVKERLHVGMDPDSDLMKTMPRSGPNTGLAKLIPLDACYFEIQKLEPNAMVLAWERSVKNMPEEQRQLMDQMIDKALGKGRLSLEKDVLPAVSGHVASALVLNGVGATADFDLLIVIQPDDMDRIRKVLTGLERASGRDPLRSDTYLGAEFKYWVKPETPGTTMPATRQMPWMTKIKELTEGPLGPIKAYAIANQYLILGTSARVVKLAVRQTDPARQSSSILDNPDFVAARRNAGSAPNEISFGYLDLRRTGEMLYSLFGAFGAGGGDLPPADKVLAELSGMFWSVRREPAGTSVEVVSPVGMLPLGTGGGVCGWVAAMNAIAAREREAHTRKLQSVWRGLETFATDFGRYPLRMSELYKIYVEDNNDFLTPDQEAEGLAIKSAPEVDGKSGYRYMTGRSPNSASNTVIVYSAAADARARHWCLFTSGKVGALSAEALAELLGKNRE